MSVSHATPSFLHSHRHTRQRAERQPRTEMDRRHRTNMFLGGVGLFLFGVLIVGFIGMLSTTAPSPSPSGGYGADGAVYLSPPPIATLWLAVILMDVVAILAFGIFSAAQNQQ